MRQRSSPWNRAEVSDDPTLSRSLSCPTDVSMPDGIDWRLACLEQATWQCPRGPSAGGVREYHVASGGVMGMQRMRERLGYDGLFPYKRTGVGPDHAGIHLERDFAALEPNTKWVTDITGMHTGEGMN